MDRSSVARKNLALILEKRGTNPFALAKEIIDERNLPYVRTYFDDFIRGRKNSLKHFAMIQACRYLDCDIAYLSGEIELPDDAETIRPYKSDGVSPPQEPPSRGAPTLDQPTNARLSGPVSLDSAHTIPVYGQAIGGDDGQFVMNGNHMADVLAPPALRGVRGAYGVYVTGESMEPRYFPGEVVYVDPTRPVRRGDFAVVQIYGDDEDTISAYVKRFTSSNSRELVLEQYNPPKQMRFPASRVKSVHRIVMGGDG